MEHFKCVARRTRPVADRLVVVCSDGSWHAQVDELLYSLDSAEGSGANFGWDWLALPGGPASLCPRIAASTEHLLIRDRLRFLVEKHATRRVVLIAHQDCGHYRVKYPQATIEELCDLQHEHLLSALKVVKGWYAQMEARAFLLRTDSEGMCWAEEVSS